MSGLIRPFDQPDTRRLMVFGHPSHELAVFGVLQRYRPRIVVLTDGGSRDRLSQSRAGLASIGMLEDAVYLDYPESSFYEALLDGNVALFEEVANRLRAIVASWRPEQIFCDAIEFYNPVHDITLPIVRAAVAGFDGVALYEVPLVYQKDAPGDVYEIQRVPPAYSSRRIEHTLDPIELARKVEARDNIYRNLLEQAGPEFMALTHKQLGREEMAVVSGGMPSPFEAGRVLRYERRARLLREQGVIENEITFNEHYLPAAMALARDGGELVKFANW